MAYAIPLTRDEKRIIAQYNGKLTSCEIAKLIGRGKTCVQVHLRQLNDKPRPKSHPLVERAIERLASIVAEHKSTDGYRQLVRS